MAHRVFIYGTLMRGHCRAELLAGQQFLGAVRTEPRYRLFSLGPYPALVSADRRDVIGDGRAIEGELWAVDDECLKTLDWVEDVDEGVYERATVALEGVDTPAQAYFYRGSVAARPDCGTRWSGEGEA